MPADDQLRRDFIIWLKRLKQTWTIVKQAETDILNGILRHKGSRLVYYIDSFKTLIKRTENPAYLELDIRPKGHPNGGMYVQILIGPRETNTTHYSNRALFLYFAEKEIYNFEVWH
jgi:hypothetical protein